MPRVGVLMGDGVSPTSYGAHWYFLDHTLGLAFDALPVNQLGSMRLDDFDVLVMPDMGGDGGFDDRTTELVNGWVQRGGTMVAVAGGARIAAQKLADIKIRERDRNTAEDAARARALRGREERQLDRWHEQIPGTILALSLDTAHPLVFGAGTDGDPARLFVLHRGGLTFEPDEGFETAAHFPAGVQRISGVISDGNIERLAEGSWLAMRRSGRGKVILFADDPLFRHFWYGTFQPYVNALLIGPRL
jgi:hypothetical protein